MKILLIFLLTSSNIFSTYSIVPWDGEEIGIEVQSRWFSVGSILSWAEIGTEPIPIQFFRKFSYGYVRIELLKEGFNLDDVLKPLLSVKVEGEVIKVAIINKELFERTFNCFGSPRDD